MLLSLLRAPAHQPKDTPTVQANTTLPTLARKFAGHDITVPAVFGPNDTLSAHAAAWANSQLATVLGNAMGGHIRRAKEAGKPITFDATHTPQALFDDIFADYSFEPSRGTGSGPRDPVEALMAVLAKEDVKARILKKGLKVRDFMSAKVTIGEGDSAEEISKFTLLVEEYLDLKADSLRARAEASLGADEADDDFDLDVDAPAEAA